jgi:hypothetical protein
VLKSPLEGDWYRKENNRREKPICGIIVYRIYSQQIPLYDYHKLTKMPFFYKMRDMKVTQVLSRGRY